MSSKPKAAIHATKPAPAISKSDLLRATENARLAERERWKAVMRDTRVRGKERDAVKILAGTEQPAKAILGYLDDPHGYKAAARKMSSAEAWDRAIAGDGGKLRANPASMAIWDQAIAAQFGKFKA